jgi:hypothetical protein
LSTECPFTQAMQFVWQIDDKFKPAVLAAVREVRKYVAAASVNAQRIIQRSQQEWLIPDEISSAGTEKSARIRKAQADIQLYISEIEKMTGLDKDTGRAAALDQLFLDASRAEVQINQMATEAHAKMPPLIAMPRDVDVATTVKFYTDVNTIYIQVQILDETIVSTKDRACVLATRTEYCQEGAELLIQLVQLASQTSLLGATEVSTDADFLAGCVTTFLDNHLSQSDQRPFEWALQGHEKLIDDVIKWECMHHHRGQFEFDFLDAVWCGFGRLPRDTYIFDGE